MHFVAILSGLENDDVYVTFADTAHFQWVTDAWREVFVPNQVLLVSVLAVFEAVVGLLVLSGGRATQIGLGAAIAFHLALWLFGGVQLIWTVVMLPFFVLLRAELKAGGVPATAAAAPTRTTAPSLRA